MQPSIEKVQKYRPIPQMVAKLSKSKIVLEVSPTKIPTTKSRGTLAKDSSLKKKIDLANLLAPSFTKELIK